LVPRSTAQLLGRLLAKTDEGWVEFSTSPPEAEEAFDFFVLPDSTRLIGRRGRGQFPNYEAVMPHAPIEATITFRRDEWLEGLEKLRPVATKQHNHPVAFDFSNGHATIKAEAEGTQAQAELGHTHVSGKARTVTFNHTYLTQYARSLETETISMRLFPQSLCEAVLFSSFRYRHLLMPLRT
jgi:DNA polymerase III sliding clamp (beta) subunit (PCNA family)